VFQGAGQNVAISFMKNDIGDYTCDILLNSPVFGENAISYYEGILTSSDNTVSSSSFNVQTGNENYTLSGTMNFTYGGVGIFNKSIEHFTFYPNPAKDNIFVECKDNSTIKICDMFGKEVLCKNAKGKTAIDIKHLPKGVYIVTLVSDDKIIESNKFVKM